VLKNYGTNEEPLYLAKDTRSAVRGISKQDKIKKSIRIMAVNKGTSYTKTQLCNFLTEQGARKLACGSRFKAPPELLYQLKMNQYSAKHLPIETTIIDKIKKAFPGEEFITQYRPPDLDFRIDLYHPGSNVVIEIDENGHNHYDKDKERLRTELVNVALDYPAWLRFNPDEDDIFIFIGYLNDHI